jgi:tRNA (guanine37-N1)-methyltransferase
VTLICGHYEGIDERVREHLVADEISIGDYVLTGGELAAMIVVDATSRFLPGVLGGEESTLEESHSAGLLEYPHYTRPPEFRGWRVPDVLLSGNHAEIARWRKKESIRRTRARRADLFEKLDLSSKADVKLLRELEEEQ